MNLENVVIETHVDIPIERNGEEILSTFISFKGKYFDKNEHFAIVFKGWEDAETPLVRIHSECMTGDVFFSKRCDCGQQLTEAIDLMSKQGGIILYLRQEGRGIGLYNKFKAYRLQDQGYNTFEANVELGFEKDERDFDVAAYMLKALQKTKIFLLSNNHEKKRQLEECGIEIAGLVSTSVYLNEHNLGYLKAKKEHGKHNIIF